MKSRARSVALAVLGASAPLVVVSSFSTRPVSQWLFVIATLLIPGAVVALGAARAGRLGRWAIAFALFAALLLASGVAVVVFSSASRAEAASGGVPSSLLLALLGLWFLPVLLTSWLYAASFGDLGVNAEQIERLRRLARKDDGGGE